MSEFFTRRQFIKRSTELKRAQPLRDRIECGGRQAGRLGRGAGLTVSGVLRSVPAEAH